MQSAVRKTGGRHGELGFDSRPRTRSEIEGGKESGREGGRAAGEGREGGGRRKEGRKEGRKRRIKSIEMGVNALE